MDICHRNERGDTPSHYARHFKCWKEWCQALARNGKHITEVLGEEQVWLLDDRIDLEGSKEEYEGECDKEIHHEEKEFIDNGGLKDNDSD